MFSLPPNSRIFSSLQKEPLCPLAVPFSLCLANTNLLSIPSISYTWNHTIRDLCWPSSGFVHVACTSASFLSTVGQQCTADIPRLCPSVHPLAGRGLFPVWALTSRAATHIPAVSVTLFPVLSGRYLGRKLLNQRVSPGLKYHQTLFPGGCAILHRCRRCTGMIPTLSLLASL